VTAAWRWAVLGTDPVTGLAHAFGHPFFVDAVLAGTAIALAAGLVGYFVVLRSQVFAGDALSHVAVTGALAALAAGADVAVGLFGACVVVALGMAALGSRGRPDDTVIGNVFAWVLGLGALFLTMYTTSTGGVDASAGINVLFGSILGLSLARSLAYAAVALAVTGGMVALARPLLFASVDDAVAAARGVPVRVLGFAFLGLVGVTAATATPAVGALLLLGLLATPAGAAQRLTARPFLGMALSAGIAVGSMWAGLCIAYAVPSVPPSFGILAVATGCYAMAWVATRAVRRRRPSVPAPVPS
jgi:zinc/manganese transport system permease protein